MPPTRSAAKETISASLGFRVWDGAPGVMATAHAHTDIEVNLVLRGRMRYFMAGSYSDIPSGRMVALWAAMPHQLVEIDPETWCMWATIPLGWFLQMGVDPAFVDGLLHGELLSDGEAQGDELCRRWVADWASKDRCLRRAVMLEVEARMLRLSRAAGGKRTRPRRAAARPSHVERLADHIGQHYHEAVSVTDIATAVGLHPTYAMQLFKRSIGIGLWEYLTRLRISHAQRLLLTSERTVLDIAMDAGFGSLGRFYDTFKRTCKTTPTAYRESVRSG